MSLMKHLKSYPLFESERDCFVPTNDQLQELPAIGMILKFHQQLNADFRREPIIWSQEGEQKGIKRFFLALGDYEFRVNSCTNNMYYGQERISKNLILDLSTLEGWNQALIDAHLYSLSRYLEINVIRMQALLASPKKWMEFIFPDYNLPEPEQKEFLTIIREHLTQFWRFTPEDLRRELLLALKKDPNYLEKISPEIDKQALLLQAGFTPEETATQLSVPTRQLATPDDFFITPEIQKILSEFKIIVKREDNEVILDEETPTGVSGLDKIVAAIGDRAAWKYPGTFKVKITLNKNRVFPLKKDSSGTRITVGLLQSDRKAIEKIERMSLLQMADQIKKYPLYGPLELQKAKFPLLMQIRNESMFRYADNLIAALEGKPFSHEEKDLIDSDGINLLASHLNDVKKLIKLPEPYFSRVAQKLGYSPEEMEALKGSSDFGIF